MIAVDHVTKTYDTFTAVDDVTFTAHPGRITGFLGPNGAGKSTTLRIVVGLTRPERGSAHVMGRKFRDLPTRAWKSASSLTRRRNTQDEPAGRC